MHYDRDSWSSSSSEEYHELMSVAVQRYNSQKQTNYADIEYFGKFFPLDAALSLLGDDLLHRQFSFAFKNGTGIYWDTYQTFSNASELKQFLIDRKPIRMDVGGIGDTPAYLWRFKQRRRKQLPLDRQYRSVVQKELVIDVDLKDVTLRTCECIHATDGNKCSNCGLAFRNFSQFSSVGFCECKWENFSNKLCQSCWHFAQLYVTVLDYCLRNIWGFRNFEFVFSGGKGFHCWILDKQAKSFTAEERVEFVESLQPWTNPSKRIFLKDERHYMDPVFGNDFNGFILPLFIEKIINTGVFDITHIATKTLLFNLYPIDETNERLVNAFMTCIDTCLQLANAPAVWELLMKFTFEEYPEFDAILIRRKIVYSYIFPVIDERITTKIEHLIKIPFSLHPNTGFISIPLSAAEFYTFKPDQAPYVESPESVSRCGDNFFAMRSLSNVDFTKFFVCKNDPLLTLDGAQFSGSTTRDVIDSFLVTFKQLITARTIFPNNQSYRKHCAHCTVCDYSIILFRTNTLNNVLIKLSWFDGMFHPTVDIGVRYAAVKTLQSIGFYKEVEWTRRIDNIF
jgi:DNA primase small subunit